MEKRRYKPKGLNSLALCSPVTNIEEYTVHKAARALSTPKNRHLFQRAYRAVQAKLKSELYQLLIMIIKTDKQSGDMNKTFNYNINCMTDHFYDELDVLANKNSKMTADMMKRFR